MCFIQKRSVLNSQFWRIQEHRASILRPHSGQHHMTQVHVEETVTCLARQEAGEKRPHLLLHNKVGTKPPSPDPVHVERSRLPIHEWSHQHLITACEVPPLKILPPQPCLTADRTHSPECCP